MKKILDTALRNAAALIYDYCVNNTYCDGCPFGGEDCSCKNYFGARPMEWDLGGGANGKNGKAEKGNRQNRI